jgi:peroxiredoxin Q/BCP
LERGRPFWWLERAQSWTGGCLRAFDHRFGGETREESRGGRRERAATVAAMPLKPGDKAPAFTLLDQDEKKVKLSDFKGRKVLVYFYPKADTPGCTKQACGLRDAMPKVGDTVVLGISPDKPSKQKKFDDKYSLGFPLLADEDHAVAEKFDVWTEKSMYGRKYMGILRSAFLVDEKGKIEEAWYKVSPQDTASNLLKAIS